MGISGTNERPVVPQASARQLPLGIPSPTELEELLDLHFGGAVADFLADVLLQPVLEMADRPSKRIRERLVHLGFDLASGLGFAAPVPRETLRLAAESVEQLHLGSLIIDDVQDQSELRRGEPTLHRLVGTPLALNASNWLYFWSIELLDQLPVTSALRREILEMTHRNLILAHCGQALDIGVQVDTVPRFRVPGLCLGAIELKTGILTAHALVLGALLGGAPQWLASALEEYGRALGIGLQMFNDLGNLTGNREPEKRWEDLRLRRPSWIWACAAKCYDESRYSAFVRVVGALPDGAPLNQWLNETGFASLARSEAHAHLRRAYIKLRRRIDASDAKVDASVYSEIEEITSMLGRAYG